jgi:hypothetical protein
VSASARYADISRMLEESAPGSTVRLATHSRVVKFNGKTYPTLPKHDTLELGHVRKMVRFLEIPRDCAQKHIPGLGPKEKTASDST